MASESHPSPLPVLFNLPCQCNEPHSCNRCQQWAAEIMSAYHCQWQEDVHPQPGGTAAFGSLPYDTNHDPMSQSNGALPLFPSDHLEELTDTPTVPFPTPPATGAVNEGAQEGPFPLAAIAEYLVSVDVPLAVHLSPGSAVTGEGAVDPSPPFHPPHAGPVLGNSTSLESWDPDVSQSCLLNSSSCYSAVASESDSPPPTDLVGQDLPSPVEAVGAKPDTNIMIPPLPHCPVHEKRKCGYLEYPRGQATWVYKHICRDCKKHFSGKSERDRHLRSVHGSPTIGCWKCDHYKQSRMDVFRDHCRKQHPEESIESLMVMLVMPE